MNRRCLLSRAIVPIFCTAVLLACNPDSETPDSSPDLAARSNPDAVSFFLRRWKLADADAVGVSAFPLPVGSDPDGWTLMQQGYRAHAAAERRRKGNPAHPAEEHYEHDYDFSWDVFTMNVPLWQRLLGGFAGRPDLRYLEIGISEGRATFWMLENILTHPSARAIGIDPFLVEGQEALLRKNIARFGQPQKIELRKGFSRDVLPELAPESFDIIYIDGSHLADDVLLDAVYTWRLLRPGGWVIHDDYMWRPRLPGELRPKQAIDAFVSAHRNTADVVHRGDQLVLRKLDGQLPESCWNRDPCSRVGDYYYAWTSKQLVRLKTREPIALSENERRALEAILRARRFGAPAGRVLERDLAPIRRQSPDAVERISSLLGLVVSP